MSMHQAVPQPMPPQPNNVYPRPAAPAKPRANPSAAPAISYTPSELAIPSELYDSIPNLGLYKKLVDAERNVDLVAARKELDFNVLHAKSMQPAGFPQDTGFLRVFVYNTVENQPWQKQLQQQQGLDANDLAEASWTLRVEGRFIYDSPAKNDEAEAGKHKFSSFLSGISVDLIPNDDYPNLAENQGNIIEWRDEFQQFKDKNQNSFDGLDIKRNGIFNLKCKIAIMTKEEGNKLRLSEKMSHFVGRQEATQQEVIETIWHYVLFKNIDDGKVGIEKIDAINTNNGMNEVSVAAGINPTMNPNLHNMPNPNTSNAQHHDRDLSYFKADKLLKDLIGVDHFKFVDLYKLLQPHFRPRDPILIDYEIDTTRSTTLGDVVLDIPVKLPLDIASIHKDISENNKAIFTNSTKSAANIANLNSKISLGVSALQNLNMRKRFYEELNENPVEFIKKWTASQAETLKALKSEEGYDEEVVRRAKYFEENEELLKEKIDVLLGSTRV